MQEIKKQNFQAKVRNFPFVAGELIFKLIWVILSFGIGIPILISAIISIVFCFLALLYGLFFG